MRIRRINFGMYGSRKGAIEFLLKNGDDELTLKDYEEYNDDELMEQINEITLKDKINDAISFLTENGYIVTKKRTIR